MSTLRISDAPLLPDVNGTEKIPTGGRGDYAVSIDQLKTFSQGSLPQQLEDHINDTSNPHNVTKDQVGLGNVDNTSDLNKPISTATQQALDLKANQSTTYTKTEADQALNLKADKSTTYTKTEVDQSLDLKADLVGGVIPSEQLPSYVDDVVEVTTATLPVTGESGKIYITTDTNRTWRWSGSQYVEISNGGISDSTIKLQTARKIANVDFDGTQNIDIPHNNLTSRNVENAHTASSISTASGVTQQDINDLTGAPYRVKAGGYGLNARVMLDNGDIVKSTVANNTVDPNTDMTGWVLVNDASQIIDGYRSQKWINDNKNYVTAKDYFASANGTQHTVKDLYTVGSAVYDDRFTSLADVQSFYGSFVDSENYLLDQAALEKASIEQSAKGGGIVRLQPGVYFYKRLTLRSGVLFMGDTSQGVFLVCVDPETLDPNVTTHGSSIKKPDDGQRVYRAGFVNIFFSTGAAGTGSNQTTYQKVIGINLAGCERTLIKDCSFAGFGYGAITLARAEGGNEGLGFLNTTHDGNYNFFQNLNFASCGQYNPDNAVIWLKYKANSNKFYATFAKGCTDAYLFVIDRSNDNAVFGGTLESSKGVAHLGKTFAAAGNYFFGIRVEGASGDAYLLDTYAANNGVFGAYHTGVSGLNFNLVNPNNRVIAESTNWLRSQEFPPTTNYSTLHNHHVLAVTAINGSFNKPLYIKSEDYNNLSNYPKQVFFNDVLASVAGNILGEMAWVNRDTSTGAAGESASIQAVAEGSAGETAIVIKTGTGTTAVERFRVKANGGVALTGGIGLFGSTPPTAKPTITGKQTPATVAELAAVQNSIISALVALGAVTDGRTT